MSLNEKFVGQFVIVRTYSAGVHFGKLEKREGAEVLLSSSRRIWFWEKAFTLSKVAQVGVGQNSKLSCVAQEIVLTEAIEVIPVSDEAKQLLSGFPEHK